MSTRNIMDIAAFELLFKEYFKPLCAWSQYKYNFEPDAAKEAVHSGFIKLWNNRDSIDTDQPVKSYLYKIVSNICLDMLKHEKVKEKHERYISIHSAAITNNDAFQEYDLNQLEADIEQALSELPEQMRIIFNLSRQDRLKYAEIADKLNISVKTVETQMSRALAKLRQKLGRYLHLLYVALFFNY